MCVCRKWIERAFPCFQSSFHEYARAHSRCANPKTCFYSIEKSKFQLRNWKKLFDFATQLFYAKIAGRRQQRWRRRHRRKRKKKERQKRVIYRDRVFTSEKKMVIIMMCINNIVTNIILWLMLFKWHPLASLPCSTLFWT